MIGSNLCRPWLSVSSLTHSLADEQPSGPVHILAAHLSPHALLFWKISWYIYNTAIPNFYYCLQLVWSLDPKLFLKKFILTFLESNRSGYKILYGLPVHPIAWGRKDPYHIDTTLKETYETREIVSLSLWLSAIQDIRELLHHLSDSISRASPRRVSES